MKIKDKLNILSLAQWDYAGCGFALSNAINTHTEHKSTAVRWHKSTLQFPHDLLRPDDKTLRDLWFSADIIHIHDAFARIPSNVPPRPTVITYHGTKFRQAPAAKHAHAEKMGWVETVATLDLTAHGLPWLPDCRPLQIDYTDSPQREFTVCHAPTKRDIKGTQAVIDALKGKVKLDLIEGIPWHACIQRKLNSHVIIDQFQLGYGCNAIEGWLMNKPVIAGGDPDTIVTIGEKMTKITGDVSPLELPFVLCRENPKEILSAVLKLRDDNAHREWVTKKGFDYARQYHSPESVSALAVEFYYSALSKFYNPSSITTWAHPLSRPKRPKRSPRRRGDIAMPPRGQRRSLPVGIVKYLGKSSSAQTWYPVGQGRTGVYYKFGAGQRLGYVYAPDLTWFADVTDKGKKMFEIVSVPDEGR
jgi:hypothetical protein